MMGQGLMPRGYDPMADGIDPAKADLLLNELRSVVGNCAAYMPSHSTFLGGLYAPRPGGGAG